MMTSLKLSLYADLMESIRIIEAFYIENQRSPSALFYSTEFTSALKAAKHFHLLGALANWPHGSSHRLALVIKRSCTAVMTLLSLE